MIVPGGHLIITTPNLQAWYNRILFALGIQPIFYETSTRSTHIGLECFAVSSMDRRRLDTCVSSTSAPYSIFSTARVSSRLPSAARSSLPPAVDAVDRSDLQPRPQPGLQSDRSQRSSREARHRTLTSLAARCDSSNGLLTDDDHSARPPAASAQPGKDSSCATVEARRLKEPGVVENDDCRCSGANVGDHLLGLCGERWIGVEGVRVTFRRYPSWGLPREIGDGTGPVRIEHAVRQSKPVQTRGLPDAAE